MFSPSVISGMSPDKWWQLIMMKENKKAVKKLPDGFANFMLSLHSCPASSGSIERVFSSFGLI